MLLNCFFLLAFMLFTSGIMFLKIENEEKSLFKALIISIWTVICIGSVYAFVLNFVNIPIGLKSMAITYFAGALFVWIYLLRDRKNRIAKIIFKLDELLGIVFCIAVWAVVFYNTFGADISIAYNQIDAGRHYGFAYKILETNKLGRMYFAALFNSLIMEMFKSILINETMYKAFIIADGILNLLNILMFYVVALEFVKNKFSKIMVHLVVLFYFIGWPIWSWIAGAFVYFGVGITLYMYSIYMLIHFDKCYEKKSRIYYGVILFMTIFCMTECYLLFSPVYMLTLLLYATYSNRNKLSKQMVIKGVVVLALISMMVFSISYWGYFKGNGARIFSSLRIDGGVHRELYKDFMFILPINIYLCAQKIKDKKIDVIMIAVVAQLFVVFIALIANLCNVISDYYYFKFYYLGWALQILGVVQAIDYLWSEKRQAIYYCILPIAMIATIEITGIGKNLVWGISGNTGTFPVAVESVNYVKCLHDNHLERKEYFVNMCRWVNSTLGDEDVPIISDYLDNLVTFYEAIVGSKFYYTFELGVDEEAADKFEKFNQQLQKFKDENIKYFTVMQDTDKFVEYEEWFSQFECVYGDGYYAVYKIE